MRLGAGLVRDDGGNVLAKDAGEGTRKGWLDCRKDGTRSGELPAKKSGCGDNEYMAR